MTRKLGRPPGGLDGAKVSTAYKQVSFRVHPEVLAKFAAKVQAQGFGSVGRTLVTFMAKEGSR